MGEDEATSCHERITGWEGWLAPAPGFYTFGGLFKSAGAASLPDLLFFNAVYPFHESRVTHPLHRFAISTGSTCSANSKPNTFE
jgi:hypothetical protein